jgi:hypothetical protein
MGIRTEFIDEYQTVWPEAYVRIEKVVLNKRNKDCWFDFTIYSEQNKRPLKNITVGIEGKLFDRYFFTEEMNIGALAYFYLKHQLKEGYLYDGEYKKVIKTVVDEVEVITYESVIEEEATVSMFPNGVDV